MSAAFGVRMRLGAGDAAETGEIEQPRKPPVVAAAAIRPRRRHSGHPAGRVLVVEATATRRTGSSR
ncbi:hypothetical protein [Nonomuraea antimicrobica]|uniref:hypothetical protein n=1 Tax=Nonomuraea antimicrobica TaxID=561173 RepID=UPI0031ED20D8